MCSQLDKRLEDAKEQPVEDEEQTRYVSDGEILKEE